MKKSRLLSREKSQQVILADRVGTRKAVGIHGGKTSRLSLRRAAEFTIARRPANKLLPSWTKGTRKCETATSTFPIVFRNLPIRIYLFDAREVHGLFLFHRRSVEITRKINEDLDARFEDIL